MAERDVSIICIAHVHPSVCLECKEVGLLRFVFGGPGAFPMSHTIGVSDCVGVLPAPVQPFVVRRSDSIYCYL